MSHRVTRIFLAITDNKFLQTSFPILMDTPSAYSLGSFTISLSFWFKHALASPWTTGAALSEAERSRQQVLSVAPTLGTSRSRSYESLAPRVSDHVYIHGTVGGTCTH